MFLSPENFIFHPDTITLVLDNDSASAAILENIPDSLRSKPLLGGYVIAYTDFTEINKLMPLIERSTGNVFPTVVGLMDVAAMDEAGIIQMHNQPYLNLTGRGVLLGFVDTGIDYTQSAFLDENGNTRIRYIWDQTIRGNPPEGFLFGSEFTGEEINHALSTDNPLNVVPHNDTVGHGTFLASVACGRRSGEYIGAAPDSEIVVVKLKRAQPFDYSRYLVPVTQENAFSAADVMLGVQYILDKAAKLRQPVAICISIGSNMHGHDGYSNLELYLAKVSSSIGTVICAAAGNEQQAGHHTNGIIQSVRDTKDIAFRASNKYEDINVSIWNNVSDRLSVSMRSPSGEQILRMPARAGVNYTHKLILERASVTVEYRFPVGNTGSQLTRIKILSATPGIWIITVYGDYILDGTYHAWLPITGFIEPETVFLNPSPEYTVVVPAYSSGVITCGAYNSINNSMSTTSSWGPSRIQAMQPDLVAPGVDVGGLFPSGYGRMSGTSVAAAITAGASALLLQWGIVEYNDPSLNTYSVRARLIAGCERNINMVYPNNRWGYGRLNLYNTFRNLRTL